MQILTIIVVVLHVIVSLTLIALILLHSGRGGGLSDMFGGGMGPGGGVGGMTRRWRCSTRRSTACPASGQPQRSPPQERPLSGPSIHTMSYAE